MKDKMVDLTNLVNDFGANNEKLKELKKVCEGKNAEIKEIMSTEKLSTFSTDQYNASYIIKESTKVDEDRLLEVLKKDWTSRNGSMECPYIKKREYVDSDALEAAIYNSQIDKDLLIEIKNCSTVIKTPTLTVKKTK